jgi:glycosyltransferase involved in cell wall biosynthesis
MDRRPIPSQRASWRNLLGHQSEGWAAAAGQMTPSGPDSTGPDVQASKLDPARQMEFNNHHAPLTMSLQIVHITSAHRTDDDRIFHKECRSLAEHGLSVTVIGPGEERKARAGVDILGVPSPGRSRLRRMSVTLWRLLVRCLSLPADVYHFHDPELISVGFVLKACGRRVVYDVHEDYPQKILSKDWINPVLRRPLSMTMVAVETVAGRLFDGIIAVTPTIAARFPPAKTITLCNYPMLEEFSAAAGPPYSERAYQVCYVGGLSEVRGLFDMVAAAGLIHGGAPQCLQLAGQFESGDEEKQSQAKPGWTRVDYRGWLDRPGIARLMANARAGLVVLHPNRCFIDCYPIKMFEYMAAGLPVVASDFPVFREILDDGACGLLVPAADPPALARAIEWVFAHPDEAKAMGEQGRRRVERLYTWEAERKKLFALYRQIAAPARPCVC